MDLSKPQKFDRKDCLNWKFIAMIILHFHLHPQFKYKLFHIQLFRERLSYNRGKAYATMSKAIMGNGGFTVACMNPMVFQRGGKK